MGHPPLIGLTAGTDPSLPGLYVLRGDYVRSIELNGGIPVVLAPSGAALHPALFEHLDGLVLTGGGDVQPPLYGQEAHATVSLTSAERDEFELGLLRQALAEDRPVLAVCRGQQVLNVALGGTLVQDLPTAVGTAVSHDDAARPRTAIAHTVRLVSGSRLSGLLGAGEVAVNSFHHQAVATLGRGLVATAFAPDGVVEAVEAPGARFILGVQWHPEAFWREPGRFGELFRALVRAAEKFSSAAVQVTTS